MRTSNRIDRLISTDTTEHGEILVGGYVPGTSSGRCLSVWPYADRVFGPRRPAGDEQYDITIKPPAWLVDIGSGCIPAGAGGRDSRGSEQDVESLSIQSYRRGALAAASRITFYYSSGSSGVMVSRSRRTLGSFIWFNRGGEWVFCLES